MGTPAFIEADVTQFIKLYQNIPSYIGTDLAADDMNVTCLYYSTEDIQLTINLIYGLLYKYLE